MNSTALFLDNQYSSLTYWFTIFGSFLAYILSILKIDEYRKNRVILKIDIKDAYFITRPPNSVEPEITKLNIVVDIRNEGRQPTTISGINLLSDITDFSDLTLYNTISHSRMSPRASFEPIRLEANDRIEKTLFDERMIYLENCDEFECTLNFKTTHKIIVKQLKVHRRE